MNLHHQPQEQSMNMDSNRQLLTHSESDYYGGSFNYVNHMEPSPENTIASLGQPMFEQQEQEQYLTISASGNNSNSSSIHSTPLPHSFTSNNSDVVSVHTVLSQQSVDANPINLPNPTGNVANLPSNMEHSSVNSGQTSMSTNNSGNCMVHPNVISSTDQKQLDSPISNNTDMNGLYDNSGLVLQHESMFSMDPSAANINMNQGPTFAYPEHQTQQQLHQQAHIQAEIEAQMHAHAQTQPQPEIHSHAQASIKQSQQPQLMNNHQSSIEHHPVVPSQRTLNQPRTSVTQNQRVVEEEQERVAAVAQHVMAEQMAQQYAMLQHVASGDTQQTLNNQQQLMMPSGEILQHYPASQETHHVVLSQMPMLSPSTPSPSSVNSMHHIKGDNSLHNAVVYQQHQQQHEDTSEPIHSNKRLATDPHLERKKSRRHTVSNSSPSALRIGTNNLPVLSSSPRSAVNSQQQDEPFVRSDTRQIPLEQEKGLHEIVGISPSLQESGMGDINVKDYDGLSRAQLISRLILLETEKLQNTEVQNETYVDTSNAIGTNTLEFRLPASDENKSTADEDEEDEEESEMIEEQLKKQRVQCKWRECREEFDGLQELIAHINNEHIGSGKPSYFCEWENCQRNEKPFTKRHKMYNHLRTHTGERPFVCTEEGCGKKFSRPDSLSTHIKTHSNIRPFICRVKSCGKAYYHARSLKKHEKSHEPVTVMPQMQFPASNVGAPSFNAMSFGDSLSGHIDCLNAQMQPSHISIHNQSLPNSPHHSMTQQNVATLQSSTPINNSYTPSSNLLSFSPAGMVEQQQQSNEHVITQQQFLDSVNQQHSNSYNYGHT